MVVSGLVAPLARADGPPVVGFANPPLGIVDALGDRYTAQPGPRATVVTSVSRFGTPRARRVLRGQFAIAQVAFDGTTAGLSADRRTLVLVSLRNMFPERSTTLAVLSAGSLRPQRFVHLRGDFSLDAVSPDGAWAYLIQYTSTDATLYHVRALSTRTGALLPRDIVDPREPDETMGGYPQTRVSSPDGRWAYTLYDGGRTFVHALDTEGLQARCIDIPAFPAGTGPVAFRLRLVGHSLFVMDGSRTHAVIDTRSFSVVRTPQRSVRTGKLVSHTSAGAAPVVVLFAVALLAVVAARTTIRRRRCAREALRQIRCAPPSG
jgi:hypothetical protein